MTDLLIRRVPAAIMRSLKRRAASHHRSVQKEALALLESGTGESDGRDPAAVAAAIRKRLARSGRSFTDSVALIREDRER